MLCVSPQYVGKLLNEKQNINAALADDETEDGLDLNAAYLKARTEYTKTQNIKLQRELSLKAGDLITREHLEEVLRAVIRRYETFADWLRKHQPGNEDALESFAACPKAALKECKQRGWLEGEGIDEIKQGGIDE